jgi:hypothetical protein
MFARNLCEKGDTRPSLAHFVGPRLPHGPARRLAPLVVAVLFAIVLYFLWVLGIGRQYWVICETAFGRI